MKNYLEKGILRILHIPYVRNNVYTFLNISEAFKAWNHILKPLSGSLKIGLVWLGFFVYN